MTTPREKAREAGMNTLIGKSPVVTSREEYFGRVDAAISVASDVWEQRINEALDSVTAFADTITDDDPRANALDEAVHMIKEALRC